MSLPYKIFIRLLLISIFGWVANTAFSQNLMQKLRSHQQARSFVSAIEKAELDQKLNQSGPFTLFVPTNDAMDRLSDKTKINSKFILNHIFIGMATERNLKVMSDITCLSGQSLQIKMDGKQKLFVNSKPVLISNIKADNGVIHIIDGVIK